MPIERQAEAAFKPPRLSGQRIDKGNRLRQQLQRPVVVIVRRHFDRRVHPVVADWNAQRVHVDAQLVLLAGDRAQGVAGQAALDFQHYAPRRETGDL